MSKYDKKKLLEAVEELQFMNYKGFQRMFELSRYTLKYDCTRNFYKFR